MKQQSQKNDSIDQYDMMKMCDGQFQAINTENTNWVLNDETDLGSVINTEGNFSPPLFSQKCNHH